ncbi:THUMP domain-containing class I SAM-dependent RNA methyltransferase [Portibacter marinus]|uniref:THUMP domain-containing class I SAM-dependent RNA methyltransferase n=1 Tax=Portibacter marinus TaxID=2898660 RepID=UPI001F2C3D14|nr:THUMP domain-containing protein [Portibacter marinus]
MELVAKTMAGLEEILADELRAIGAEEIEIGQRAVTFFGDKEVMYRANLELRTALRILMPISRFRARNENDLYSGVKRVYWDRYIRKDQTIAVNSAISSDFFNHSHYVALKTKDAIVDQLRDRWGKRPDVDVDDADIRINTHIHRDKVTISLDSSGSSLHKRGYRLETVEAPINEVLAAGLILLSEWNLRKPFYDPMCGSGTFLCEAARMAIHHPPQFYDRTYGFMNWKGYDGEIWEKIVAQSKEKVKPLDVDIVGFDLDPESVQASLYNIAEAGLKGLVQVHNANFFENSSIPSGAHVMINPPYDIRLKQENIIEFFKEIGDHMKKNMPGTEVWIISSNIQALKLLGLKPSKKFSLYNGPNPAKFHKFELYEGSRKKS